MLRFLLRPAPNVFLRFSIGCKISRHRQEWKAQLRSSLHPAVFAAIYRVVATLASVCNLSLPVRAELFIAAPKVTQAVFAALLDCYTWKLAEKVYGRGARTAIFAVRR